MNLSIFSLSLKYFNHSPFISKFSSIEKQNIDIKSCNFEKFFSPLIFSISSFNKIRVYNSKITNSLSQAVIIEEIPYENIKISKYSRNAFTDKHYIIVSKTVFRKCISDKRGSVFYIQHNYCTFALFNSAFFDCTSTFTNGAIFFRGRKFVGSQNCFNTCTGKQAGSFSSQAFILSAKNGYLNSLNESSIISCSPFSARGRDSPCIFWKGNVNINNINSSYNHILGKTCGLSLLNIDNSYIRFLSFFNSTGFYCLNIQGCKSNDELSYLNFERNDICDHGSLFFLFDSYVILCNSVFCQNVGKLISATGNWKFQIDSCVSDVKFDETAAFKNVFKTRCVFGTKKTIETYKIKEIPFVLCANDCGDNPNCVKNIVDFKEPDYEALQIPVR